METETPRLYTRVVTDHDGNRDDGGGLGPPDAQLIGGVWLPANEKHLVEMLVQDAVRREVDGQLTYQYRKLERALALIPADRRRRAVDIGAHCGLWSMQLVKHFAWLWAFEPNHAVARLWRWNVPGVNSVLHELALGKGDGRVGLKTYEGHSGHTQVTNSGDIPMRSLDSFGFIDVDFVKIDVEGVEAAVCKGAEETLLRSKPVIVLEQKGEDGRMGLKRDGALEYLKGLGAKAVDCIGGDYFLVWE